MNLCSWDTVETTALNPTTTNSIHICQAITIQLTISVIKTGDLLLSEGLERVQLHQQRFANLQHNARLSLDQYQPCSTDAAFLCSTPDALKLFRTISSLLLPYRHSEHYTGFAGDLVFICYHRFANGLALIAMINVAGYCSETLVRKIFISGDQHFIIVFASIMNSYIEMGDFLESQCKESLVNILLTPQPHNTIKNKQTK